MTDRPGTPQRWQEIEELFGEALELTPAERAAFLARRCQGDAALRQRVEALLAADEGAGEFLDRPALGEDAPCEDAPGAPAPPLRIGPYRVLSKLGEGGMSRVYLAARDDEELHRRVALKCLRHSMEGEDARRRMELERQILASLDHPHIARIYDAGTTEDGLPYFVMELIEGEPITEHCRRARSTIGERLELVRDVASAVHLAHQNLVVHRDIKPSNILVRSDGVVKLLDFGIAKLLNPELSGHELASTLPWRRFLTPDYASPEQIRGQPIQVGTDVWALGVLLYELLSGVRPFRLAGRSAAEIERLLTEQEAVPPSLAVGRLEPRQLEAIAAERRLTPGQLRRRLAGDLDTIVGKALAKEPARRYASAEGLAEDLRRHRHARPITARKPTFPYRAGRFLRRNRLAVAVAAAFAVLVASSVVALAVLSLRLARERDQAAQERDRARLFATLLEDVFAFADPGVTVDADVTAREILDRGAWLVPRLAAEQPEVQVDLMATIGNIYRRLGLFDDAAALLEPALETRRRLLGAEHPATLSSVADLAALRRENGHLDEAEALFREALERGRQLDGEPSLVAESWRGLAATLTMGGRYDEAEAASRQALALYRQSAGTDRRELVATLADLGTLLALRGELEEAVALQRDVLERARTLYGDRHVAVAASLNRLAATLIDSGSYEEPEGLLLEALEIYRSRLGLHHPEVLASLNNLGSLATFRRDFAKAEGYYQAALEPALESLGEDHPSVTYLLLGIGAAKLRQGDAGGAEAHLRRAAELRRRIFGGEHFLTAKAEILLGSCLLELGRHGEAEAFLLASQDVLIHLEPPRPREMGRLFGHLERLYLATGRDAEAAAARARRDALTTTP